MTYPIIPELYGIVARKLLDEIGEKSFYSGSFSFDYGSKECRLDRNLSFEGVSARRRRRSNRRPGSRLVGIPYIRPSGGTPQRFLLFRA